jgi:hypothetical protein
MQDNVYNLIFLVCGVIGKETIHRSSHRSAEKNRGRNSLQRVVKDRISPDKACALPVNEGFTKMLVMTEDQFLPKEV